MNRSRSRLLDVVRKKKEAVAKYLKDDGRLSGFLGGLVVQLQQKERESHDTASRLSAAFSAPVFFSFFSLIALVPIDTSVFLPVSLPLRRLQ